jgi:hypothetical protein
MFYAEQFKSKYAVYYKIFSGRTVKFYKCFWIVIGVLKEVVMFMKTFFGKTSKLIFNIGAIKKRSMTAAMVNYVMNNLMGRACQRMNGHGVPFLEPKGNRHIKLAASSISFRDLLHCHVFFTHNDLGQQWL